MKIRVILADDHTIVLEGLRALLSTQADLDVVEVCTDGDEAFGAVQRMRPDVLVIDQSMPGCTGVEVLARLKAAGVPCRSVLLTATLNDRVLMECIREGALGIVLKESAGEQLIKAIREAHLGRQHFPPEVMGRVLALLQGKAEASDPFARLTDRERDVITELAKGHSNKRIAGALGITDGTVKMHLHSIFKKLGVSNRLQLTLLARERPPSP